MTPELLVQSSIKMSCILVAALAASAALRRRSAALRHWVLAAAILCAAAVPAVEPWLPVWQVRVGAQTLAFPPRPAYEAVARISSASRPPVEQATMPGSARARDTRAARAIIFALWLGGVVFNVLMLAAGLWRLTRISASARPLDGAWAEEADAGARDAGIRRRVRVLQAEQPGLLFTWGLLHPAVVVPPGAGEWPRDRIRAVLRHELAHVRRADWLTQLLAETVCAVCWINPLFWAACRRLRRESEQAADDAVLEGGIEGGEYAMHVMDVARAFASRRESWLPAPAMLRRSDFERRIGAMLRADVNRRPVSIAARVAIGVALLAGALALASAQGLFSTFSGTVYDPLNGLLPNVRMMLTNTQTGGKYEIRSDSGGRFEFVGLPPGRYALETELPGFMALRGSVEIAGQNVQRDVTLAIGSLQETVSVWPGETTPPPRPRVATAAAPVCRPAETGGIGGNLRAPTKLVHVTPLFPPALAASGASGVVVLDATIGVDGTIRDVRARSTDQPQFEGAAIDAVRQWEFSQTLLNCVPVEVLMTVTVNFAAR